MQNVPGVEGGRANGIRAYVRSWFFDAPFSSLCYEDIRDWLAWGLYERPVEEMDKLEQEELAGYVRQLECLTDARFPHAAEPRQAVPCMKPTWEPCTYGAQVVHFPLLFYAAIGLGDFAAGVWLRALGFKLQRVNACGLDCWVSPGLPSAREGAAAGGANPPVALFAHGLGVGLLPYCPWFLPGLLRLRESGRLSGIVLLRQPHVSMAAFAAARRPPPTADEAMAGLEELVSRLAPGSDRPALLIGHSYGTFLLAQACRCRPGLLRGVVMLDPMCFMLHLGTTTSRFCYAPCELTLRGVAGCLVRSELNIGVCMRRHFRWHENCLWLEDLEAAELLGSPRGEPGEEEAPRGGLIPEGGEEAPRGAVRRPRALVVVADRDNWMPVGEVVRYLRQATASDKQVELCVLPDTGHGDLLVPGSVNLALTAIETFLDEDLGQSEFRCPSA